MDNHQDDYYEVYNIGREERISAEVLARLVKRLTRSKSKIVLTEPKKLSSRETRIIRQDLQRVGLESKTSIEEGMMKVIEGYK